MAAIATSPTTAVSTIAIPLWVDRGKDSMHRRRQAVREVDRQLHDSRVFDSDAERLDSHRLDEIVR